MFCTKCGSQVADGQKFCTTCGAPMKQITSAAATQQLRPEQQPYQQAANYQPNQQYAQPGGYQAYQPAQPQPPKKGMQTSTIVIIVAAAVIVIAAIIIAVVLLMPKASSSASSTANSKADANSSVSVSSTTASSSDATASSTSTQSTTSASASSAAASSTSASSSTSTSSNDIVEQARQGSLNHSGYILPTDTKKYSESELSKLDDHTLFLARNEIYARHGRKFVSQELQTYFAQKSWYKPSVEPGDFQDSWLSDTERSNATTMLDIEKSRGSKYLN